MRSPLMPLALFKVRNLAVADIVGVLWAASMFTWFFLSALYMQLVLEYSPLQIGLAFLPSNLIMAAFSIGLSAKLVIRYGFRAPLAVGLGLAVTRPAAVRTRSGRRQLRRRHPPEHDLARLRRGHGLQPGAARSDERRGAGGIGPRLGHRQHVVHDGRCARPRGSRERRRVAHRQPSRFGRGCAGCAHRRLPRRIPGRRDLCSRGGCDRRRVPGEQAGRLARTSSRRQTALSRQPRRTRSRYPRVV